MFKELGSGPPILEPQPSAEPNAKPGKIISPDVWYAPRSIEHFREIERHQAVSTSAGDDDLFMDRIDSDSRGRDSRKLLNWDFPAGRSVPTILDAPDANRPAFGATDNPALRRINLELAGPTARTSEAGLWSAYH